MGARHAPLQEGIVISRFISKAAPCGPFLSPFSHFFTPVTTIVNPVPVLYIGFSLSIVRNGLFHEKQPL
jgi:hypothetical protein